MFTSMHVAVGCKLYLFMQISGSTFLVNRNFLTWVYVGDNIPAFRRKRTEIWRYPYLSCMSLFLILSLKHNAWTTHPYKYALMYLQTFLGNRASCPSLQSRAYKNFSPSSSVLRDIMLRLNKRSKLVLSWAIRIFHEWWLVYLKNHIYCFHSENAHWEEEQNKTNIKERHHSWRGFYDHCTKQRDYAAA